LRIRTSSNAKSRQKACQFLRFWWCAEKARSQEELTRPGQPRSAVHNRMHTNNGAQALFRDIAHSLPM
jgi:hypothetical protein